MMETIIKMKKHPILYILITAVIVMMAAIINQTMKALEIETPETIKGIVSVYKSINNELVLEHERNKRQYLEKYGLREIKTNKTRTALEQ